MIKGVNRRIVEITSMENDYFEKAVLYIRPEKMSYPQNQLDLEAKAYLMDITSRVPVKNKLNNGVIRKIIFAVELVMFLTVLAYAFYYFCA